MQASLGMGRREVKKGVNLVVEAYNICYTSVRKVTTVVLGSEGAIAPQHLQTAPKVTLFIH